MPIQVAVVGTCLFAVIIVMVWRRTHSLSRAAGLARERAEIESQLELVETKMSLLMARDSVSWWEFDADTGGFAQSADAWTRLGGTNDNAPSDLTAILENVHPDDHSQIWSMIDEKHDSVRSANLRLLHESNPTRWIDVAATPLPSQPNRRIGVMIDVTEERRATAELQHRLEHDSLTGLSNWFGLANEMEAALADGRPFALALVDLDHFKDINFTLGHPVGDRVLVSVGRRFAWTLRKGDVLARLGGDEFAVLIDTRDADPEVAATDLVEVLDAPVDVDGVAIGSRVSVGLVVAPDDGDDVDTLFRRADLALHRAKQRGRSWARFNPDDEHAASRRLQLSEDLPFALAGATSADAGLVVHFQPVVELASGRASTAEALVRWNHPTLGDIPSSEFVGLSERYGLGKQLFEIVLNRSLAQLAVWRADGLLEAISVNVSPYQLMDPMLVDIVSQALDAACLPAGALMLEITEDALIDPDGDAVLTLRRLHELGVKLAIDDFGTGYSSLATLRVVHIDVLKLDKLFVQGVGTSIRDDALMSLALGVADGLDLTVVAEGVERPETMEFLSEQNCHAAQGFLLCRPNTADVVTDWLVERTRSFGSAMASPARGKS